MKILFTYSRFPWPLVRGDQLTVYKLLSYLAPRHEVDLLCVAPPDMEFLEKLPSQLRSVSIVPNSWPARIGRSLSAAFRGRCLQIDSFMPPAFGELRRQLIERNPYDIVYSHYIRSFGHENFDARNARKVIGLQLSHQVHFDKASKNARNPAIRQLYALEARRLKFWEGRIASFNQLIHLISPNDCARIRGHESWRDRVFFNPHGVDETQFLPAPEKSVKGRVVFTGNLRFQANEDAVIWLTREIWPRILRYVPDASLVVAGSSPTGAVINAVRKASRAELVVNPEHMWEVIQTAEVSVDPLRIGAGLQNKILEALSCGVPVVSTSLGNEGVGAEEGEEIILRDTVDAFSKGVVSFLTNPLLRKRFSNAGRSFIERAWSWEHHFKLLEDRWECLLKEPCLCEI